MTREERDRDTTAITAMIADLRSNESFYRRDHQGAVPTIIVMVGHALYSALVRIRDCSPHWRFDLDTGELTNSVTQGTVTVARGPHATKAWHYTAVFGVEVTQSAIPAEQAAP